MISVSGMSNELFDFENNVGVLYDDFLTALSLEFGKDIVDERVKNWLEMSWEDFSFYLFNKGIDLENSSRNWKSFFKTQKEIFSKFSILNAQFSLRKNS